MGMYFIPPQGTLALNACVSKWLANNPGWLLKQPAAAPSYLVDIGYPHLDRSHILQAHADASALAERIVDDDDLERVLGALVSPTAQEVEQAVLAQRLPSWQARLLTDALTLALNTVRDRRRTALIRAGVLLAVAVVVIGGAIWIYRNNKLK